MISAPGLTSAKATTSPGYRITSPERQVVLRTRASVRRRGFKAASPVGKGTAADSGSGMAAIDSSTAFPSAAFSAGADGSGAAAASSGISAGDSTSAASSGGNSTWPVSGTVSGATAAAGGDSTDSAAAGALPSALSAPFCRRPGGDPSSGARVSVSSGSGSGSGMAAVAVGGCRRASSMISGAHQ